MVIPLVDVTSPASAYVCSLWATQGCVATVRVYGLSVCPAVVGGKPQETGPSLPCSWPGQAIHILVLQPLFRVQGPFEGGKQKRELWGNWGLLQHMAELCWWFSQWACLSLPRQDFTGVQELLPSSQGSCEWRGEGRKIEQTAENTQPKCGCWGERVLRREKDWGRSRGERYWREREGKVEGEEDQGSRVSLKDQQLLSLDHSWCQAPAEELWVSPETQVLEDRSLGPLAIGVVTEFKGVAKKKKHLSKQNKWHPNAIFK